MKQESLPKDPAIKAKAMPSSGLSYIRIDDIVIFQIYTTISGLTASGGKYVGTLSNVSIPVGIRPVANRNFAGMFAYLANNGSIYIKMKPDGTIEAEVMKNDGGDPNNQWFQCSGMYSIV